MIRGKVVGLAAGLVALTIAIVVIAGGLEEQGQVSLPSRTDKLGETLSPQGFVVVSVFREGVEVYHYESHNLITNAGKDFISSQLGSTSASTNGANFIALSTDSGSPAVTDTTLTGEITTGGLARAQGTYAHTTGTNTFTVQKEFTASATHTAVQKTALFTASSSGTMMAENTFSSVNLISNDKITITWTITV